MNHSDGVDFMDKINNLKNKYYSDNKKNLFFKDVQRSECANTITKQLCIEDLIYKTCYILKDTNKVFIDYLVFKSYALPENYEKIVEYILSLFNYCIQRYDGFEAHINLSSFTLSAAERYKSIINIFIQKCMISNSGYSIKIIKINIYNTPATFSNISKLLLPLIDNTVKSKIIMYDKNESAGILKDFFGLKN